MSGWSHYWLIASRIIEVRVETSHSTFLLKQACVPPDGWATWAVAILCPCQSSCPTWKFSYEATKPPEIWIRMVKRSDSRASSGNGKLTLTGDACSGRQADPADSAMDWSWSRSSRSLRMCSGLSRLRHLAEAGRACRKCIWALPLATDPAFFLQRQLESAQTQSASFRTVRYSLFVCRTQQLQSATAIHWGILGLP